MHSKKLRVIIPILGQGSVVHIIRTGILDGMKEYCEPVIVLSWNDQSLTAELQSKSYEVHLLPEYRVSDAYIALRQQINAWYLNTVLKSASTRIQEKYMEQYMPRKKRIKKFLSRARQRAKQVLQPHHYKKLLAKEAALITSEKTYRIHKEWFASLNGEGLFTVTPFIQQVELIARIAHEKKIPVIASIHSFDNVTKRDWPAFAFDHYIVWNKYNKAELQRIHAGLSDDDITIAGAPQFDFHFVKPQITKAEWCAAMNIPAGKKIILYAGGPQTLFPNETQYLRHLSDAFENGIINDDAIIFFRSHPLDDMQRWKKNISAKNIIFDEAPSGTEKKDHTNVLHKDVEQLMNTLRYTDLHINLCSTISVDGSAFHKPQIGPAYDETPGFSSYLLKQMYQQEHYLPIMKTGSVQLADSKKKLIELVNEALASPENFTKHSTDCLHEIITYTDGQSANRVIHILKKFFAQ